MASMKRGTIIASTLLLVSIILSACTLSASEAPAVTNTPIDQTSLFATALGEPTLRNVESFGTQTAIAAGTVLPTTAVPAGVTPQSNVTATSTPLVELNPTNTPTATLAVVNNNPTATVGQANTPAPSGPKPGTYVLKTGEFPYCIARRFNVDPDQLLSASGLSSAQADSLSAGTVLTIPQGGAFPGDRSWHDHPATFTVGSTYDTNTVYGVACYYGDIDPSVIAQNNGISVDAVLTVGQTLNIP